MDIQKRVLTTIVIVAAVFCSRNVSAQQTLTADSLYTLARTAAFVQKDYPKAISLAKQGLTKSPLYTDIRIFLGRVYTWNKNIDSAREIYQSLLQQNEHGQDVYLGYADAELSDNKESVALDIVNNGLTHNPASTSLLTKQAVILLDMGRKREALEIADSVLVLEPHNRQVKDLGLQIKEAMARNSIGIKYDYVSFEKQFTDPWHLVSIEYSRLTDSSTYTARINYANRFRQDGMQYELEAYPHISKTFYGFLNFGYADKAGVFPKWKAGASLFANLPKAFEAELGFRYLYFFSDNYILTGYVGKYYRTFLFGARAYLSPQNNNISQSYNVIGRYYFGGKDDYVNLSLGTGISPDDPSRVSQLNSVAKLRTYRVEVISRISIRRLNVLVLNASYASQEYLPNTFGNQYQVGIGYIRKF